MAALAFILNDILMRKNLIILLLACSGVVGQLQAQYRYGLKPQTYREYIAALANNPALELVDLEKFIPGLVLDIRYATNNNFTGEKIYDEAKAFARKPVAEALLRVQNELKQQGLGIKVFDGYRPYRATVRFYEVYKDTTYVASPYRGSRHNRGCALDLTIVNLKTREELEMPTGYDSFKKEAWPSTPVKDPVVRKNREMLINIMEKHGFKVNGSEWWHFDFIGWKKFDVMDIDFAELQK